jgi:hypothetical protein
MVNTVPKSRHLWRYRRRMVHRGGRGFADRTAAVAPRKCDNLDARAALLAMRNKTNKADARGLAHVVPRKAAEGVYVMSSIEEKDLDEETRAKLCDPGILYTCRISSAEALAQMARATARAQREPLHVLLLRGEEEQAPN